MTVRRVLAAAATALFAVGVAMAAAPRIETPEQRADRIAGELRCPVCQALSIRDSPSETARAMRDVIAERIAQGRTDDEIRREFREAYGDWILLSPPLLDWTGLAWLVPIALVSAALLAASRFVRPAAPAPLPDLSDEQRDALRERLAVEEALER